MIRKSISDLEYVVFDLETTGFNPLEDQIIEIGAVKLNGKGEIVDTFSKFISLYKKDTLPEVIVNLTNITDEMLVNEGENIDDVMAQFLKFIKETVLVAQNIKFDMSFLDQYYIDKKIYLKNLTLDTIDLAKQIYPNKASYKLAKLIEYFNVDYDENAHHRADYDAKVTSEIFVKGMKDIIQKESKNEMIEYVKIFNISEATISQKRYLYVLLTQNNINIENKIYLTKFNAARQISILAKNNSR